ncbi:MAG: HAD family hydrolase [Nitrospinota bacterium]|nr:MAG: HAD family hydrolase [Nitrospinota bacterium]
MHPIFSRPFGIFDLDHTIFNQRILLKRNFGRFFQRTYGIPPQVSMRLFDTAGHLPLEERFRLVLQQHRHSTSSLSQDLARFWELVAADRPVVYEAAREVLQLCRNRGIVLFGTTDLSEEVMQQKLVTTRLDSLFSRVCGQETGPKGLPHLTVFAQTVSLPLSSFIAQAFYVVGNLKDLAIARAQGIYSVGIAHTVSPDDLRQHGADQVHSFIGILLQDQT